MIAKSNITGIILAGGKSSRMGTDKGFVLWKNKTFIQHSIDAIKPLVNDIIIVSDFKIYDTLGYKRVADSLTDAGPLSGLYSGLTKSNSEFNLVVSCDVPRITNNVLNKVIEGYTQGNMATVCVAKGKVMPLIALYHKSCVNLCKTLLSNGERRMMYLLSQLHGVNYVHLNKQDAKHVENINSPTDLKKIENGS